MVGGASVVGDRGELTVAGASPEGFQLISRAQVLEGRCWGMPVHSGGRTYCRSFEGDLVCVDVREW